MSNITQKWVDVLLPFTSAYDAKLTASDLARKTGVPQQTASRILHGLGRKNLLRYERHGRNKLYSLDLGRESSKTLLSLLEHEKALVFLRSGNAAAVIIEELVQQHAMVVVFGSYANNTADEKSDLDLLIVGNPPEKSLEGIKARSSLRISDHHATEDEVRKLLAERHALAIEIASNHLFFGDISRLTRLFLR